MLACVLTIVGSMTDETVGFVLRPIAFGCKVYTERRVIIGLSVLAALVVLSELLDRILAMVGAASMGIPVSEFINAWMHKSLFRPRMTLRDSRQVTYHVYKD